MKKDLTLLVKEFEEKYNFKPNALFLNPSHLAELREDEELSPDLDLIKFNDVRIIILQTIREPEILYI